MTTRKNTIHDWDSEQKANGIVADYCSAPWKRASSKKKQEKSNFNQCSSRKGKQSVPRHICVPSSQEVNRMQTCQTTDLHEMGHLSSGVVSRYQTHVDEKTVREKKQQQKRARIIHHRQQRKQLLQNELERHDFRKKALQILQEKRLLRIDLITLKADLYMERLLRRDVQEKYDLLLEGGKNNWTHQPLPQQEVHVNNCMTERDGQRDTANIISKVNGTGHCMTFDKAHVVGENDCNVTSNSTTVSLLASENQPMAEDVASINRQPKLVNTMHDDNEEQNSCNTATEIVSASALNQNPDLQLYKSEFCDALLCKNNTQLEERDGAFDTNQHGEVNIIQKCSAHPPWDLRDRLWTDGDETSNVEEFRDDSRSSFDGAASERDDCDGTFNQIDKNSEDYLTENYLCHEEESKCHVFSGTDEETFKFAIRCCDTTAEKLCTKREISSDPAKTILDDDIESVKQSSVAEDQFVGDDDDGENDTSQMTNGLTSNALPQKSAQLSEQRKKRRKRTEKNVEEAIISDAGLSPRITRSRKRRIMNKTQTYFVSGTETRKKKNRRSLDDGDESMKSANLEDTALNTTFVVGCKAGLSLSDTAVPASSKIDSNFKNAQANSENAIVGNSIKSIHARKDIQLLVAIADPSDPEDGKNLPQCLDSTFDASAEAANVSICSSSSQSTASTVSTVSAHNRGLTQDGRKRRMKQGGFLFNAFQAPKLKVRKKSL